MQAAPTSACPVASISATSDLNRGTFGIRLNFSRDYKERAFLCAKITGSATRDTTTVAITNIRPSSRSPHKASFARVLEEERYCLLSCDLATEDGREARGWLATFIVEGTWTFDPLEISTRDKSSTSKRARGEKSENEHKSEQEGSPETLPKVGGASEDARARMHTCLFTDARRFVKAPMVSRKARLQHSQKGVRRTVATRRTKLDSQ